MGFRGVLYNYLCRRWLRIAQLFWQLEGDEVFCGQAEGELRSFLLAPFITSPSSTVGIESSTLCYPHRRALNPFPEQKLLANS